MEVVKICATCKLGQYRKFCKEIKCKKNNQYHHPYDDGCKYWKLQQSR